MTRKISDVLWLAFQYAKQDRHSLIDAYGGDRREKVVRQALADVRAFERLQMKLFGTTRSHMEAELEQMKPISVSSLLKLFDRKIDHAS